MTERTQFATGMATDDPGNAAVVLESRGLQKTYGSGEKSICVLADANLSLRRGGGGGLLGPPGGRQKKFFPFFVPPGTPTHRAGKLPTQNPLLNNEPGLAGISEHA